MREKKLNSVVQIRQIFVGFCERKTDVF